LSWVRAPSATPLFPANNALAVQAKSASQTPNQIIYSCSLEPELLRLTLWLQHCVTNNFSGRKKTVASDGFFKLEEFDQ
jgi:hypothetical protein